MSSKPQSFDPTTWSSSSSLQASISSLLASNDLQGALTLAFSLPKPPDPYVYRAIAAVTLPQAQRAVSLGRTNGLHRWYAQAPTDSSASSASNTTSPAPKPSDDDADYPPPADIAAYTALFAAGATPAKALTGLGANAKKGSVSAAVAAYLTSKRQLDVAALGGAGPGRWKGGVSGKDGNVTAAQQHHFNPALDFWAWSCGALEWAGPCDAATRSHVTHPTLPIFMHHFGCVAPSYEALEVIRLVVERRRDVLARELEASAKGDADEDDGGEEVARKDLAQEADAGFVEPGTTTTSKKKKKKKKSKKPDRPPVAVLDIGSGNGYWTYLLRRHGLDVHAVDSGQSAFRTSWIGDTVASDGARWLKRHFAGDASRAPNADVLLLVYPVVGADFTRAMLREYRGRDVVVAGTQNRNGYTGFRDLTMDEFMATEHPDWRRVAQIPLPSFAGKDEALFVFSKD